MNEEHHADHSMESMRVQIEAADRAQAARDALFGGPFEDGKADEDNGNTRPSRRTATRPPQRLPQGFFAPADIACYMGMSTYRVQELCRRGELRHVKDGRSIRIRKEWADRFMADREREPLQ